MVILMLDFEHFILKSFFVYFCIGLDVLGSVRRYSICWSPWLVAQPSNMLCTPCLSLPLAMVWHLIFFSSPPNTHYCCCVLVFMILVYCCVLVDIDNWNQPDPEAPFVGFTMAEAIWWTHWCGCHFHSCKVHRAQMRHATVLIVIFVENWIVVVQLFEGMICNYLMLTKVVNFFSVGRQLHCAIVLPLTTHIFAFKKAAETITHRQKNDIKLFLIIVNT